MCLGDLVAASAESWSDKMISSGNLPETWRERRIRELLAAGSFMLMLFGGACFLGHHLLKPFGQFPETEFPTSNPVNVAVDSKGRIYLAENGYDRVQRYSADGRFERGWWIPRGAYFALRITPDDRIWVAATKILYTYTPDGELVASRHPGQHEGDVQAQFAADTTRSGGYRIEEGMIPRIVDTRDGRTVIKTRYPLILVMSPFPAFAYFFLGTAGIGLWQLWGRRILRRLPGTSPTGDKTA